MKWRALPVLLLLLLGWASALSVRSADDSPKFVIKNEEVPAPASPPYVTQREPRFTGSPETGLYLTWHDSADCSMGINRSISRFEQKTRAWEEIPFNQLVRYDEPFVTGARGLIVNAVAAKKGFMLSVSTDHGANWSSVEAPPASEINNPKNITLQFLPDDSLLASWLETNSDKTTSLHAGLLEVKSAALTQHQVIDARVTADATPAITTFPDGSALIAYRGLDDKGLTDIRTARFRDNKWEEPKTLNLDEWTPKTPPLDAGPVVASRGPHLAAAWFSEGYGARINVSTSSSAGEQWLMPTRIDDITPLGRPSIVLLDDGSQLVTWVERESNQDVILLRRISSRGTLSVPVRLAANITGHPRITRVKDGDTTPAQILLAYLQLPPAKTSDGEKSQSAVSIESGPLNSRPPAPKLVTRLITLPDATQLAEADACDCDPRPEDQRGFAFTGRITAVDTKAGTVTIAHDEIPGLMKAASTTFKAAPDALAAVKTDTRILARMERIGADWWLFNPRTLITP